MDILKELEEHWVRSFPNRVWEPTGKGWHTREATAEDIRQRREFSKAMAKARMERLAG